MTGDAILTGFHILFATIWVGPQVLVAAAVIPALHGISDDRTRIDVLDRFTRRFNLVAWPAMLGLLITGGILVADRIDEVRDIARAVGGDNIYDVRWGYIFGAKMALVALAVLMVALHSFLIGPTLVRLQRAAAERSEADGSDRARALRRWSVLLAVGGLIASIFIIIAAGFLEGAFALRGA